MSDNALTIWYSNLAPRDQRILSYGAIGVAVILLAWLVLDLQGNVQQAHSRLREQREQLAEMNRNAPVLAAAGPGRVATAGSSGQSLVVLIDSTARESGLAKALTGTTPASNGAMRVQLENANFNLLLGWLHRLSTQQGVLVEDATITGNGGGALVNVSVQLRRGQ